MKITFSLAVALACALSLPSFAQSKFPLFLEGNVTLEEVTAPQLGEATTNQRILALARAAKINLWADATFFSDAPKAVSLPAEGNLLDSLMFVGHTDDLSMRQSDTRTFLMWGEPEVISAARTLVAEAQTKRAALAQQAKDAPQIPRAGSRSQAFQGLDEDMRLMNISGKRTGLVLADYLQKSYNWDGQSENLNAEFPLEQLPDESAAFILETAYAGAQQSELTNREHWDRNAPWLSDELWRNAEIGYFAPPFAKPDDAPVIAVHSALNGNDYFSTLLRPIVFDDIVWRPTDAKTLPRTDETQQGLQTMTPAVLGREKSLDVPVTLEVSSTSLNAILAELQKQSGIELTSTPGLLADRKITARATQMPVREAMDALTGLYGIVWAKKADGGYSALAGLSAAEADALQLGDPQLFRVWKEPVRADAAPAGLKLPARVDLVAELSKAGIEEDQLKQPQGVKFSVLPAELQSLIRRNLEERFAFGLIYNYQDRFLSRSQLPDIKQAVTTIRVMPTDVHGTESVGALTFNTGPALIAEVIVDGDKIATFGVYGKQIRQQQTAEIQRYEKAEQKIAQQERGAEDRR